MTSRFLVVTTLTASLAAFPMLASADTGGPAPARTPSVVSGMLAQAGSSSGATAGTSATTGAGAPSTSTGSGTAGTAGMGSGTGSGASSGSTGTAPYQRTMPNQAQMPYHGQMQGHQMQGQMGNFDPHHYRSTTDCLNAAAAAGMALSACGNTHGR
ncbi:hypothetical protein [Reyranella sp.]|jgi:hypothetical protein|uniref:hypothetical protein n=1 Tax=Reyranella sp. TaxID=1929291 RepID=UPI002F91E042